MSYREIDITDPATADECRMYLVPHEDGLSLMCNPDDSPEREIFLTKREVQRFVEEAIHWLAPKSSNPRGEQ